MGNDQSFASNQYRCSDKKEPKTTKYTPEIDQDIGRHLAGSNDTLKYGVKSELQYSSPASCNAGDFLSTSKILEVFPNGTLHFRRECVIQTTNDGGAPRKVAVRAEDGRWKIICMPTTSFSFAPAGCNADENESENASSLATSHLSAEHVFSNNKMCESQSVVYNASNDYRKLSNGVHTPRTRRKDGEFLSASKILELFPNETGTLHFRRECVIQTTNDGGAPRKVAVRAEDGRWEIIRMPTKSLSGVVIPQKQINELFPFGHVEFRGALVTHTTPNGETREVAIYAEDGCLILLDTVAEELDII